MELLSVGCIGDAREMLVLRRRTGGVLYLLLLCWILAAQTTVYGECGFIPRCVSVRARVCVCVVAADRIDTLLRVPVWFSHSGGLHWVSLCGSWFDWVYMTCSVYQQGLVIFSEFPCSDQI